MLVDFGGGLWAKLGFACGSGGGGGVFCVLDGEEDGTL